MIASGLTLTSAVDASAAGRWERRADMAVPRQEIGLAAIGETLYAVGGFAGSEPSAAVEAYDTRTDTWSPVAPLPQTLHHVAVAAVGSVVYAAGGFGASALSGASDAVYAFDPAVGVWTVRASLPRPRGAAIAGVIDGRIYVAGGLRDSSVSDLAVFDPGANTWTELAPMPTARDHLAAGVIGGRLFVVGGRRGGQLFDVVEVFDPATGAWSAGRARMPTARGGLGAGVLDGLLYAVGGEGNAASALGTFPQAQAYDPVRDAWMHEPDMGLPRHGVGVAPVGGALYVMGGATRQGFGPSGAGEVFIRTVSDALSIRRLVVPRAGRLVLRGRLLAARDVDPATAPVRLEVNGAGVASLPAGRLVPSSTGSRWHLPRGSSSDFRRFTLRARGADLAVHLVIATSGLPEPGSSVGVAIVLDARTFAGSARIRGH
jgi:N-acetylneuraminic acid mutarotase